MPKTLVLVISHWRNSTEYPIIWSCLPAERISNIDVDLETLRGQDRCRRGQRQGSSRTLQEAEDCQGRSVKKRVKRVVRGSASDKELTDREKMTTRNEQSVWEVMITGSESRYNSFDETLQRNIFTYTAPLSWNLKVASSLVLAVQRTIEGCQVQEMRLLYAT